MWHATCTQKNRGDSWLLVIESQITNLTPSLSFGNNLCFKCPNESCNPILNIYISRVFQWYKEFLNLMGFDFCNRFLNVQESISNITPKMGVHLRVWGFIPSHSPTLLGAWDATLGLPLGPHLYKPLPWSRAQG